MTENERHQIRLDARSKRARQEYYRSLASATISRGENRSSRESNLNGECTPVGPHLGDHSWKSCIEPHDELGQMEYTRASILIL